MFDDRQRKKQLKSTELLTGSHFLKELLHVDGIIHGHIVSPGFLLFQEFCKCMENLQL